MSRQSGPVPCKTPGCGLVYTPGYFSEHVRDYHWDGMTKDADDDSLKVDHAGVFYRGAVKPAPDERLAAVKADLADQRARGAEPSLKRAVARVDGKPMPSGPFD